MNGRRVEAKAFDTEKLRSAKFFRERLDAVLSDPAYDSMRDEHRRLYESAATP